MMSFEECQAWGKKMREERAALDAKCAEIRKKELLKQGINPNVQKTSNQQWDHPCMPDNKFVTFLYILGMVGCLIFKQWYIGWFALTVWYGMFITRHDSN